MQTVLYLVRHGHVHNPDDILYARLPRFRLSEKGVKQARTAARFFQTKPLAVVYSSPLLRARQTAMEILEFHPDIKRRTSSLIHEVHTPFEGRPASEVFADGGDVYSGDMTGYEQPEDLAERMRKFSLKIRRSYPGQEAAAVSHGDPIVFMLLWAKGKRVTPKNKTHLESLIGIESGYPDTGSVTKLVYASDEPNERPSVEYIDLAAETQ